MKRIKLISVFSGLIFSILVVPGPVFSMGLYDDFSGAYIDKSKWREREFVREIRSFAGNNKLLLKNASLHPTLITAYNDTRQNDFTFSSPNSVNSIQADVAIVENNITNLAYTRARLVGRWYNDGSGTPGSDMTGDIQAEVALRGGPTGLFARWAVYRLTNPDGSTSVDLGWGDFTTSISIETTYTLFISYDETNNKFTFKIGTEEVTFGPSDLPTRVRNANRPLKDLNTRVQINNSYSFGYISATFDNVYKNGSLYEDFPSLTINNTKWTTYEYVRENSEGKFRSKVRSSTGYTSNVINRLELVDPSGSNVIQAKVTPLSYQNSQGLDVQARIGGNFYQDGSSGGGYIGGVGASVWIGGNATNPGPVAGWYVWKYTDLEGNSPELVDSGTFSTSITLGSTYTLSIGWDGSQITFKCEGEIKTFTPATPINPFNHPWKEIATRIMSPAGKEATIEALFDDVMNEWDYIPLKGLSAENMGLASWDQGHDEPSCISNTPGYAHYYAATRDFVDSNANGLKGTGAIYGFANFAAALSAAGYTLNDLSIKFGKVSLGNDTPGVDWEVYDDTELRYYYTEGDNDPLTIYIDGTPILQQNTIKITVKIDYNNPSTTADDILSGYTSFIIPTNITIGTSTPQLIKNIASAFLDDLNGRAVRIEFPSLTVSGVFTYDGKAGYYLDVPNAKLVLDQDGIITSFATKLNPAFKYEDLALAETLFSDSYLSYGETREELLNGLNNDVFTPYNSIRTNIKKISYILYQDMADVTWSWIVTGKDGSNNTILIWKEEVQHMVFRKENGNWVFYGNQEKYDISADSIHDGINYFSLFNIHDPSHAIHSVTVAGTGISGTLDLDYFGEGWNSFEAINYGLNPPSSASYTITIIDGSGTHTYNRIIDGGVTGFATNLSPSGNVYGNPIFTFTGLPRDGVGYEVTVFDSNWNWIWEAEVPPQTTSFCPYTLSISYSGPALSPGIYHYNVNSKIGDNFSMAVGQFTYSGIAGTLSITPSEGLSASGPPGGIFNPSSQIYTLSNTGGTAIDWSASKNKDWVDLSQTSGALAAGATTAVTVSINNNANGLAAGTYADTVTFTNTTNNLGNTTRNVTLSVTGGLSITPVEDLDSSGFEGGPFDPTIKSYILMNTGTTSISWVATKTKTWVKLSKTSGTLAAGTSITVTVSILSKGANTLEAGTLDDIVTFTNKTNGIGTTTRKVNLLVDAININLFSPGSLENYTVCTYYPAFGPPTFKWDINGGTLKSLELQFYAENNPSKIVKVKATATELSQKSLQVKAATWKKIFLLPGLEGGKVNWKAVGTKQNKKKGESNTRSFFVSAPEAVGAPQIDPTSKAALPVLSWDNNCNLKFKVWFYNDPEYYDNPTKAGVKKASLSFTDTDPTDNLGVYTKELTSGQWTAIQNVVGKTSGSKIYWHVESSDVVSTKRIAETIRQEFILSD